MNQDGAAFAIVKTGAGYASIPTTAVSFSGTNGSDPLPGLIADTGSGRHGTLFQNTGGSVAIREMTGTTIARSSILANPGPMWQI